MKSADDCHVLQMFINGERTDEINEVFCSSGKKISFTEESVCLTPKPRVQTRQDPLLT